MKPIRQYILEKVSLESQVMQYIKAMEAVLYKFHYDVYNLDLSPEQRVSLESRAVRLIAGKKDYTSSAERTRLFKELNLPIREGAQLFFQGMAPAKAAEVVGKSLSTKTRGLYKSFLKLTTKKLKSFSKGAGPSVKQTHGFIKVAALVAILVSLSITLIPLFKKTRQNNKFRRIVDADVNPVVIAMVRRIARKEFKGVNTIRQIMNDLEQAIAQKYFIGQE